MFPFPPHQRPLYKTLSWISTERERVRRVPPRENQSGKVDCSCTVLQPDSPPQLPKKNVPRISRIEKSIDSECNSGSVGSTRRRYIMLAQPAIAAQRSHSTSLRSPPCKCHTCTTAHQAVGDCNVFSKQWSENREDLTTNKWRHISSPGKQLVLH